VSSSTRRVGHPHPGWRDWAIRRFLMGVRRFLAALVLFRARAGKRAERPGEPCRRKRKAAKESPHSAIKTKRLAGTHERGRDHAIRRSIEGKGPRFDGSHIQEGEMSLGIAATSLARSSSPGPLAFPIYATACPEALDLTSGSPQRPQSPASGTRSPATPAMSDPARCGELLSSGSFSTSGRAPSTAADFRSGAARSGG